MAELSATLGALTLAAAGTLRIEGRTAAGGRTLGAIKLAAAASLPNTGSAAATLGAVTLAATDSTRQFFFAWTDEGVGFSAAMLQEDEEIVALEIAHSEGDFPTLRIDVRNPKVGLLAAGRNRWCWLSWLNGGAVEPLFNGRLIGIPEAMTDEVARLQFVARPPDFAAQKEAAAAALRVLPYWDPVWLQERVDDPDTVLETRTARWHIGRTDLTVTVSDIVAGEAGTIEVGEADHLYEDFEASYSEAPLRRVIVKGTVGWTQEGEGDVDLTDDVYDAFVAAGSPYEAPIVASLTAAGLLSSWPEAGRNIGGGWSVAADSTVEEATWVGERAYVVEWVDKGEEVTTLYQSAVQDEAGYATAEWSNWQQAFPLGALKIKFGAHYAASRARTETVTATIAADVQALLVEPGAAEEETIELSSQLVGEPVDDGGALPIGDLARNSYFKTARGAQSWENLLLLGRARHVARARAVRLRFVTTWAVASGISCRHSVRLVDNRLPGGEATGKVVEYALSASGEGDIRATVAIACTIGYGNALAAPEAGTPTCVEDVVLEDGIQARSGAESEVIAGTLQYQSFDDFTVTDDDGIDLLDMRPETVLNALSVENGPTAQVAAIDAALLDPSPDPGGALREAPTRVTVDLKPVTGGAFHVDYEPEVSELVIPQTIDLEAA